MHLDFLQRLVSKDVPIVVAAVAAELEHSGRFVRCVDTEVEAEAEVEIEDCTAVDSVAVHSLRSAWRQLQPLLVATSVKVMVDVWVAAQGLDMASAVVAWPGLVDHNLGFG